jgi:hypothetical protein
VACRITELVLDAHDPDLLARFWCTVLGARRADIAQTGNESWHVLADPEGNEFCLLRRQVPTV